MDGYSKADNERRQEINKKKRDIGPLQVETNFFKPHSIVFEEGDFVIVKGLWKPTGQELLCCRWHIRGELGFPVSYGKSMWMQLPESVQLIDIPEITRRDKRLCILSFGELTRLLKDPVDAGKINVKKGRV